MPTQSTKELFLQAIDELTKANVEFHAGTLSPVEHSRARETALTSALLLLAQLHDVTLRAPLFINSNGEYLVVASNPQSPTQPAHFNEAFAKLLTDAPCRTGVGGYATLLPENSWCYLLHFHAENMVLAFAEVLHSQPQAS